MTSDLKAYLYDMPCFFDINAGALFLPHIIWYIYIRKGGKVYENNQFTDYDRL